MADENVGPSTGMFDEPTSIWPAGTLPSDPLGQPLERSGGRLHIVVRGGLHGGAYQAVCSAVLGERLQHGTPIHRLRRDSEGFAAPDGSTAVAGPGGCGGFPGPSGRPNERGWHSA